MNQTSCLSWFPKASSLYQPMDLMDDDWSVFVIISISDHWMVIGHLWGYKFLVTVNWLHDVAYGPLDLKPLDARRPQKRMAHEAKSTTASMALAYMDLEIYESGDVGSSNPWPGKFLKKSKHNWFWAYYLNAPSPSIPKREIDTWKGSCMSSKCLCRPIIYTLLPFHIVGALFLLVSSWILFKVNPVSFL